MIGWLDEYDLWRLFMLFSDETVGLLLFLLLERTKRVNQFAYVRVIAARRRRIVTPGMYDECSMCF